MHPDSRAALAEIRAMLPNGAVISFVSGNFNVVHPGHLRLLKFAADCGQFLVVGVNSQDGAAALIPETLRLEGVRAISFVNHAFILRERPETFIAELKPAVVVKGKEHEARHNAEREVLAAYGGQLMFSSGDVIFSSIDLIKDEFRRTNFSTIVKPSDFPRRHGFAMADLKDVLARTAGMRALVLGDLIVDEYLACDPLGMSQEDPALVVTPVYSNRFVGGAGIVASHARGLGVDTRFITVTGSDATAEFAAERLSSYGVDAAFFRDDSRPTTLKQRYRAGGHTLLRVSHLKQHQISQELQARIMDEVRAELGRCDLVVFSDFNYGCLPQGLVDTVVSECGARNIPMVADSQSSSQVGDVSRFRGMLLLKPTEREARLALRDFSSGLVVVADELRRRADAKNVVLTLGGEGLLIHAEDAREQGWLTDRLPAFNNSPRDTAGAGDSFLVCAALALAVDADIWQSAYLGSLAAACQVSRVGNLPLSAEEIVTEIDL